MTSFWKGLFELKEAAEEESKQVVDAHPYRRRSMGQEEGAMRIFSPHKHSSIQKRSCVWRPSAEGFAWALVGIQIAYRPANTTLLSPLCIVKLPLPTLAKISAKERSNIILKKIVRNDDHDQYSYVSNTYTD